MNLSNRERKILKTRYLLNGPEILFFDKLCFLLPGFILNNHVELVDDTFHLERVCSFSVFWSHLNLFLETVWWPDTDRCEKWAKPFRVAESNSHDLLWPLKKTIWSFKYARLVYIDTETPCTRIFFKIRII